MNASLYLHGIAWYMLGQYCPLSLFSQTRTVLQKNKHSAREEERKTMKGNKVMAMNVEDHLQNWIISLRRTINAGSPTAGLYIKLRWWWGQPIPWHDAVLSWMPRNSWLPGSPPPPPPSVQSYWSAPVSPQTHQWFSLARRLSQSLGFSYSYRICSSVALNQHALHTAC